MGFIFENQSYQSLGEFIRQEAEKENYYGRRLEFAHEIDSGIIQALQVRTVKRAVDKLADILVSEDLGIQLSTGIAITPSTIRVCILFCGIVVKPWVLACLTQ